MTLRSDPRSGERGVALIVSMFMVLVVSVVGSSMMMTARTETFSSVNYRTTAQARYASESGVAAAAHNLMYAYVPPATGSGTDPIAAYDTTGSPVQYNGAPVVLSANPDVASNYPVAGLQTAFDAAAQGTLDAGIGQASYAASAMLLSMFEFTDAITGVTTTLQAWEVTGVGTAGALGAAEVEVSSILERATVPIFAHAAFATSAACGALTFTGGSTTDSYDSSAPLVGGAPALSNSDGHVGTNGNLTATGSETTINGALSTPNTGTGACAPGSMTGASLSNARVSSGIHDLPVPPEYDDPEAITPAPPTIAHNFTASSGCPADLLAAGVCVPSTGGATLAPNPLTPDAPVSMGNVTMEGGAVIRLSAGTYEINSLTLAGNARIVVDSGPVIFRVEGADIATPIDLSGGGVTNPSFVPSDLQFRYAGDGNVELVGGTESSMLVYAPNADITLSGGADFYGSMIGETVSVGGGARIHYDRGLGSTLFKVGSQSVGSFSWHRF